MNLKFKRLHEAAQLPTRANPTDSGMDLYAVEDTVLLPGVATLVRTGLAVELPETMAVKWETLRLPGVHYAHIAYEAQIRSRSGLALKHGIQVLNSPGTVDNSYRGEIGVIMLWSGHAPNVWEFREIDGNPFDDRDSEWIDSKEVLGMTEKRPEMIHVTNSFAYKIRRGDRIAQLVIAPVVLAGAEWADELSETERGGGGFGSTGK